MDLHGLRGRGFCALGCENYFSFFFLLTLLLYSKTFLIGGLLSAQGLHVCCFSLCRNCFSISLHLPSPPSVAQLVTVCLFFFFSFFCSYWLVVLVVRGAPAARPSLSHYFWRFTSMCCTWEWPPALWLSRGLGGWEPRMLGHRRLAGQRKNIVYRSWWDVFLELRTNQWPSNPMKTTFRVICWPQICDPVSVMNLIIVWFEDSNHLGYKT